MLFFLLLFPSLFEPSISQCHTAYACSFGHVVFLSPLYAFGEQVYFFPSQFNGDGVAPNAFFATRSSSEHKNYIIAHFWSIFYGKREPSEVVVVGIGCGSDMDG